MQCFTSMLILHYTIVRSVVVFVCLFVECFLFICLFIICLLRFCVWLIICLFWIDWWWWCGRSVYLTLGSQLRSGKCVKNVESFVENHLSHKKTIPLFSFASFSLSPFPSWWFSLLLIRINTPQSFSPGMMVITMPWYMSERRMSVNVKINICDSDAASHSILVLQQHAMIDIIQTLLV